MLLNYDSLQLCLVVAIGFWLICVIQVCIGLSMLIESHLLEKEKPFICFCGCSRKNIKGVSFDTQMTAKVDIC